MDPGRHPPRQRARRGWRSASSDGVVARILKIETDLSVAAGDAAYRKDKLESLLAAASAYLSEHSDVAYVEVEQVPGGPLEVTRIGFEDLEPRSPFQRPANLEHLHEARAAVGGVDDNVQRPSVKVSHIFTPLIRIQCPSRPLCTARM